MTGPALAAEPSISASIPASMLVVACRDRHAVRVERRATPQPRAGEVLIRVGAAGLCGSDIERLDSGESRWEGRILGHEIAGVVVARGTETEGPEPGTRVVLAPLIPCFACASCARGRFSACDAYSFIGSRRDGGFAEFLLAPARNVLPIPDQLSMEHAVFVEPLTIALHAVRDLGTVFGASALVTGAGTIGLLMLQVLRAMRCHTVVVSDPLRFKRDRARVLGADRTIDPSAEDAGEEGGVRDADLAIECSGANAAKLDALNAVRAGGHVELVGTTAHDITLPAAAMEAITRRELVVRGSWMSYSAPFPGREWRDAVWMLAAGLVDVDALVTHRYPLADAEQAISSVFDEREPFIKVLFQPGERLEVDVQ